MVDISSGDKKINITVSTSGNKASVNATSDTAMYNSNKSREWAISDKIVSNEDYSSKYYANVSKQNADKSTVTFENLTTNYNQYKNELENIKDSSVEEITTLNTSSLAEIETAKTNAISDITNQETLSVDNVNTAGQTQVNLAKEQATIATTQAGIATAKTSEVVESGNAAITAITEQETTSKNNIETKGAEQIELIQNEGATQIANVQTTGQTEYNKIIATGIDYKANTDLDNLSEVGEKHFLNKQQITNCLLEVPQRIKYTLKDGVLTAKAGSVVIVPYGTEDLSSTYPIGSTFLNDNFKVYDTQYSNGKFFVWAEIVNDISTGGGTTTTSTLWTLSLDIPNNRFSASFTSKAVVDAPITYGQAYNTTTNVISSYGANSTVATGTNISFPLLLAQSTANGYIASMVYQVFNGIGYIGSIIWVDKGVKGLIPNGRNADGSLKNIEYTTEKLVTRGYQRTSTLWYMYLNSNGGMFGCPAQYYYEQETQPAIIDQTQIWYKPSENIHYYSNWKNTSTFDVLPMFNVCDVVWSDANTITSSQPKQPFRALDYNDITSKFDGQWVISTATLSTATRVGTYTIDLSSYLPNDNYSYEVIFSFEDCLCDKSVLGKIKMNNIICITCNTDSRRGCNCFIYPVVKRSITMQIIDANLNRNNFMVHGYRRIGTNQ